MAQDQLVAYNSQFVPTDTAATKNTVAKRDTNGGLTVNQSVCTSLDNTGSTFLGGANKTASFTADQTQTFYECDATSGAIVPTLPPAAASANQIFVFVKIDSSGNHVTVTGNGSELISGSNTQAITSQWGVIRVRCNAAGTAWYLF